jgi:hypothetical protein
VNICITREQIDWLHVGSKREDFDTIEGTYKQMQSVSRIALVNRKHEVS